MLYNQELKEEFINSSTTKNRNKLREFFEKLGRNVESVLHKDLNQMSRDEIRIGLSNMGYKNYSTLRNEVSQFSQYINWCIINNKIFNTINPLLNFDCYSVNIDKKVKLTYIKDEEVLFQIINNSYYSLESTESVVLLLKWCGLSNEEIINLKNSDVDFESGTVLGRKVSDRIMNVLKLHHDTDGCEINGQFRRKVSFGDKFVCKFLRFESVMQPELNEFFIGNLTKSLLDKSNYAKTNNIFTTPVYICESKKLFDLHEREVKSGELTREDYVEICNIKSSGVSNATAVKDYMALYESYKRVFWD